MLGLHQDGLGLLLVHTGWKGRDSGSSTDVAPTPSPRRGQPTPCSINTGYSLWRRPGLLILFFKQRKALNHQNDSSNLVAEGTQCPGSSRSAGMSGVLLWDHLEMHNCLGSLGPLCCKLFLNCFVSQLSHCISPQNELRTDVSDSSVRGLDYNHKCRHN